MRGYLAVVAVLVLSSVAHAGMFFCGNETRVAWYAESVDPSRVAVCNAPYATSQVKDPAVATAQAALVATVGQQYLKVSGVAPDGLMVEMTQAEKDDVNRPQATKDAATVVAKQEMQTNEVCANNTLQQITDYWKGPGGKQAQLQATITTLDSAIAAVTAGTAKTALVAARDALVAQMTMFVDNEEKQWRYICAHGFVRP